MKRIIEVEESNFKFNSKTFEQIIKSLTESLCYTILKKLIEFNEKHECCIDFTKIISNEKSIFTSIYFFVNIDQIIQFFIDNDAYPNILYK